ncbi:MAG: glycosyltransferase family 2 protein [Candidatus Eremiobacteraeota bacterium]|nr:glycosyltransferase family 2 protein [Candidatus Eremiobacteraeota bacterium]
MPRAFASVPPESSLLVVDAESSDATVALAQARGARTIVRPWAGFVAARRFALGEVTTPWTFMLDADEALDAELRAALTRAPSNGDIAGYTVARSTYFCGRPMRAGAWGRETPLRLFRTTAAALHAHPAGPSRAELHERWTVAGPVAQLAGTLHHYSYPSVRAYIEKFARYTSLEAQSAPASPRTMVIALAFAAARVPWLLVRRGAWRDGWRGWFIAVASALYPVAVAWKAMRIGTSGAQAVTKAPRS